MLWILAFLFRRFPTYTLCYFLNEILLSLPQYVSNVLFLKYMVQAILDRAPISKMLVFLAGTGVFLIFADIYSAWFQTRYQPCAEETIQRTFFYYIKDSIGKQPLSAYDSSDFYDDIEYVSSHIVKDSLALLSYISGIMAALLNIVLIINLFYQIGIGVLLISSGAVVVVLLFETPAVKLQNARKYEITHSIRKQDYFRNCFFERESFSEIKMTKISSILFSKYQQSIEEQISIEQKYGDKICFLRFLSEWLSTHLLMNLVLTVYLLYKIIVAKTLPGGEFIATYNGANIIMSAITDVIYFGGLIGETTFSVEKFRRILSMSKVSDTTLIKTPLKGMSSVNIEIKNMSFRYPGTDKNVLQNINLQFHTGQKIAIVGKNGSGKTTLVNLLMGLYTPTEGEILINGKHISSDIQTYRHQFSAFFQDMKPLEATISENVALDTDFDSQDISNALHKANFSDNFAKSIDTVIGVRFESSGRILSGGEIQKLMLANCFYSNRPVIVMDEPSSALDPIAERELNLRIAELSEDKLAIFITHRLSTVHMAEKIYVLDNGCIVGQGTHEELLAETGIYRDMWQAQITRYME